MSTASYVRLSLAREGQTSIERQARDNANYAAARGWDPPELYEDLDVSGFSGVTRPAFERLISDIEAGIVQRVIIWKIDRLSRNLREFLRFTEMCDRNGVAVSSVNEPFDTSSPIGRAITQVLAIFAELESATIGMRVKSARDHAARQGIKHPGDRPAFGLKEEDRATVAWMAEQWLKGMGLNSIARELNRNGTLRTEGGQWRSSDISRLFKSPHIAGLRQHHGELLPGDWVPCVDTATWQALQMKRKTRERPQRKYFLTGGIARCGECETPLMARPSNGRRKYKCSSAEGHGGCGAVTISADALEDYVTAAVLAAVRRPEIQAALATIRTQDDGASELEQLIELKRRRDDLGEDYATGLINRDVMRAATIRMDDLEKQLKRRLEKVAKPAIIVPGVDPLEDWAARDIPAKSSLVSAIFSCLFVKPGRTLSVSERVVLVPRH